MLQTVLSALALTFSASWLGQSIDRESLGIFGDWGAFRDSDVPRCFAIAEALAGNRAFASVGIWPQRDIRQQVHFRLSRQLADEPRIQAVISGQRFAFIGGGRNGWAQDAAADGRVVTAMRAASTMSISATDSSGRRFTDRYSLNGVATAIDAATVGCTGRF